MFNLGNMGTKIRAQRQPEVELAWQTTLSDYVTAVDYAAHGRAWAASSAAGEVVLYPEIPAEPVTLQPITGASVDCLAFSADGQYLAAAGQNGQVCIWQVTTGHLVTAPSSLLARLDHGSTWIDLLAWSPTQNLLAFGMGRYIQIWDATTAEILTTLHFSESSALALAWDAQGQKLTVGGYQGVKIWNCQDWDQDPYILEIPSATVAVAWSADGQYLAAGNLDRTITVLAWGSPDLPWAMRGFPGKIRCLCWSDIPSSNGAGLLAAASVEGVVVWEKLADRELGWDGRVLEGHGDAVQAIRFKPQSLLLASAASDGLVYLWPKARFPGQVLTGAPSGFACLAWHPQGDQLVTGGQAGELLLWSRVSRGRGFRRE
jgi:WD40 repeat protein